MLNYIWLGLIIVGIAVAVWGDWNDLSSNRYHNGEEIEVTISLPPDTPIPLSPSRPHACRLIYSEELGIDQQAEIIIGSGNSGALHIFPDENTPPIWRELYNLQKNDKFLAAHVTLGEFSGPTARCVIRFDPVSFVRLNSVTNDGIIKYAKIAVELSIGLIGVMSLWLGLMKIAEQSGLIAKLARLLKPLTTRLFPDVPPDHPAMGAMIMNISANMLGLANAATPLGLKAMEELNKLNKKVGTATDAMCTFLVINTSNVQLIPATVIAIRASAGASNPAEIIGPVIVATTINTIVGVVTVKLLARMKIFRKQLETGAAA